MCVRVCVYVCFSVYYICMCVCVCVCNVKKGNGKVYKLNTKTKYKLQSVVSVQFIPFSIYFC